MTRKYNVTDKVGRPKKYDKNDFDNIIYKKISDKTLADIFSVSVGTIQAIRHNLSKKLKIKIKDKWKKQSYGGKNGKNG